MATRPRIQHVSVPRPLGSGDQARAFYGGVLGWTEVSVPSTLHELDLVWYRLGDTELHLFGEDPLEDCSERHLCVEVEDVEATRRDLLAAGYAPSDTTPIRGRPRFFCRDPFGNKLEFTTVLEHYE